MLIVNLEATFLMVTSLTGAVHTLRFDEADGVEFRCPRCILLDPPQPHTIIAWFTGRERIMAERDPGPGRMVCTGTSLGDLTLTPELQFMDGCGWRGFVTDGNVTP